MSLSDRTVSALRAAGWSPERLVPTTALEDALIQEGHVPPYVALDFLARVGGLRLLAGSSAVHFDAPSAVRAIDRLRVLCYGERAGADLCPIGEADGGQSTLLMDERGRVFSAWGERLLHLADGGFEAIDALISGKDLGPVA